MGRGAGIDYALRLTEAHSRRRPRIPRCNDAANVDDGEVKLRGYFVICSAFVAEPLDGRLNLFARARATGRRWTRPPSTARRHCDAFVRAAALYLSSASTHSLKLHRAIVFDSLMGFGISPRSMYR